MISMGLWACAGCASTGPADRSEAELPARSHCTPLSGDPLPSMCSPHGYTTSTASGRAHPPDHAPGHPPAAPRDTRVNRDSPAAAPPADRQVTGGTVPATTDEPVSPELMPEAPFSAWGVPVPWLPETTAPADTPPVVLEHATDPGAPAAPPVAEEPITRYEQAVPAEPEPTPSGTPVEAALDA
ncbi:hypothetical protein J2S43_003321 [Catenuloplanes nepalensis]|uniref:Uncharacterized protein n=1 Tax=Catenuloplanes nepalensis TaxID=587533 RepID=A0ABT9MTV5_9ACTN|nr:hypothetical protein [Catenuloplanes nepalensis]MDP9794809.1 hypothetical protein [Catenuloplanes nepalensis]